MRQLLDSPRFPELVRWACLVIVSIWFLGAMVKAGRE